MLEFLPEREVMVQVGGWPVRWYGVLYVAAYVLGWWLAQRLQRERGLQLSREQWLEITAWIALGVLTGGRLGYVLFYEPAHFVQNPANVWQLWQGGMSLHGGLLGVAVAVWGIGRVWRIDTWQLADVLVVPAAAGLVLGRLGNIINEEIYLTPLMQALAVLEPLVLVAGAYVLLRKFRQAGSVTAAFLMAAGITRFCMEWGRADVVPGFVTVMTRGQELALVTAAAGFVLAIYLARRRIRL